MLPRNGLLIVQSARLPLPIGRGGTGTALMFISSLRSTRIRQPRGPSRSNVSSRRRVIGLLEVRLILCRSPTTWLISGTHSTIFLDTKASTLINALIEYCFQPRCVLSPMDADFCVQFVRVMHLQGTPGFWTLTCYDRVSSLLVHPLEMIFIVSLSR